MTSSIDFVLPSCYGIPEPMWLVVSTMIESLIQRCWLLLGGFVTIKMDFPDSSGGTLAWR